VAKYKKGERIRVTIAGSRIQTEGKLIEMKVTKKGNLFIVIERDGGLPSHILSNKADLTIEKVIDEDQHGDETTS